MGLGVGGGGVGSWGVFFKENNLTFHVNRQMIHIKCEVLFSLKSNKISFKLFASNMLST